MNDILFNRWSDLRNEEKGLMMRRLRVEKDPFRQTLLDSLLHMDPDELFMAFEDGYKEKNWQVMALVVQAMPDEALIDYSKSQKMIQELALAFELDEPDFGPEAKREMNFRFPYQYAFEKLTLGNSDCFKEAIMKCDKLDKIYTYDHLGFYAGVMMGLKDKKKDSEIVDLSIDAMRALEFYSKEFSTDIDSYFYGFKFLKDKKHITDIVASLVSPEVITDSMSHNFSVNYMSLFDNDPKLKMTNLRLIELGGFDNFAAAIEKLLDHEQGSYVEKSCINENFCAVLRIRETMQGDYDMAPVLRSFCDLQLKRVESISGKIDPTSSGKSDSRRVVDNLTSDTGFLGVYTEKSTLEYLLERAKDEIILYKNWWQPGCHIAEPFQWELDKYRNLNISSFTLRCLALSGTRHPDILRRLDADSCQGLIKEMDQLGIEFDSRAMMKLNVISKEHAFERDLGI